MAQIKAKQIKLSAQGDFIIGDANNNGSILSIGSVDQTLISNGTTGAWGYLDKLRDPSGIIVVDTAPTISQVNNIVISGGATGTGPTFTATGSDANIDINLTVKGTGEVLVPISYSVSSSNALATKSYVDGVATGLDFKNSVLVATTAPLVGLTYTAANDTGSAGATPWASGPTSLVIDGVTLVDGDRILVKDETGANQPGNGIFTITGTGTAISLVRAADADNAPGNEVSGGMFTFVESGTINANTGWVMSDPVGIATLGTDNLIFTQFSEAGVVNAGNGLSKTGTILDINVDNITTTFDLSNNIVVGHNDSVNHTNQVLLGQDATGGTATAQWSYLDNLRDVTSGLLIIDGVGVSSSTNYLSVTNAITGSPVSISSVGSDTNIDLQLIAKGTGRVDIEGNKIPDGATPEGSVWAVQVGAGTGNLSSVTQAGGFGDKVLFFDDVDDTIKWVDAAGVTGANWSVITTDSGTVTADVPGDTLAINGGEGIATTGSDNPEIITANLDLNNLLTETVLDPSADQFVFYDSSIGAHRKITLNNILGNIGEVTVDSVIATGGANESFTGFFTTTPVTDSTITVFFNGLALDSTGWTRVGTTLTLVDSVNGYSTDAGDIISARYVK